MFKIHKSTFEENLKLTQSYCELQLKNDIQDYARILRSINPNYGEKQLFKFVTENSTLSKVPNLIHPTVTKWMVDPIDHENIVDDLFNDQIIYKKNYTTANNTKIYSGRILISKIDCTVIDGASEAQSLGFIDLYDIPPIDTWFYMARTQESRLLFTWIPNEFVQYANEAVEVNCVDCINWVDEWFPEGLEAYFSEDEDLLVPRRTPNKSIANSGANNKKMTLWSHVKHLFGA